ncbi:S-adenosylmethionine:tRNA ribosyltransferase-isomerase, partial [Thermus scotoductus]|uniref:S-adenosylmethionine:tRNA ribosyltransferase-isomerase n=1 Tax=Thermus scotoductus TaxID=37636 RepID=UPI0020A3FAD0
MSLEAYDYFLPEELIAQEGMEPRDRARMLVVHREGPFRAEHRQVRDLPEYLRSGDVLVFNESKVIPARLLAQRPTGGRVEVLLVRERAPGLWEALVGPGRKAKPGTRLRFLSPRDLHVVPDLEAEVVGVDKEERFGGRTAPLFIPEETREALAEGPWDPNGELPQAGELPHKLDPP